MAGMKLSDVQAMKLAMEQALLGQGFVSPNPLVGCVILDEEGQLLSHGFHAKAGEDHAEICALKKVMPQRLLHGAKVYVTLEPCAHYGRTPPCAQALAQLPIAEVIYGIEDPNPLVAGKGLEILRAAGKKVRNLPEMTGDLEELAEIFLFNIRHRRTFVALKVATSLDGKLAFHSGESQWITHEAARAKANEIRGSYDAVAVGARTILQDRPRLTLRHPRYAGKKTGIVVILDPQGQVLSDLPGMPFLQGENGPREVLVVVNQETYQRSKKPVHPKVSLLDCPSVAQGELSLEFLCEELYRRGLCSLFVEGGAQTHSAFLEQRVAQRLYQFVSPILMGGLSATTWTKDLNLTRMADRIDLHRVRWEIIGPDALVTGRLSGPKTRSS